MGTADTAQACTKFANDKASEFFRKLCEGRQRFYQELRDRNGIPKDHCAWCGNEKGPGRDQYETCSTKCAEASEKESRSYAIQLMAPC